MKTRIPYRNVPFVSIALACSFAVGCDQGGGGERGTGPTLLDKQKEEFVGEAEDVGECVDVDPYKVIEGTPYTRCDGSAVTGKLKLPAGLCKADGDVNCIANQDYPAIEAAGAETKIAAGEVLAGVEGTFQPDIPDRANVLSTDTVEGEAGLLTLPDPTKVLATAGAFGPGGSLIPSFSPDFPSVGNVLVTDSTNGQAGTLAVCAPDFPAVSNVLSTDTVDGQTGTLTLPPVSSVFDNVLYGPASTWEGTYVSGCPLTCGDIPLAKVKNGFAVNTCGTGTLLLPPASHVHTSQQYGEDTDPGVGVTREFTGLLTLPAAANVLATAADYGISGTSHDPVYVPDFPAVANVLSTDTVNSVAGTLTLPAVNKVQGGTFYGSGGNSHEGTALVTLHCLNGRGYTSAGTLFSAGPGGGTTVRNTIDDHQNNTNPFYGKPGHATQNAADQTNCDETTFQDVTGQAQLSPEGGSPFVRIFRDQKTGLYVSYSTDSAMTWESGLSACDVMNAWAGAPAGTDWHLPTQKELYQLYVDGASSVGRGLVSDNFTFGVIDTNAYFWSATTSSKNTSKAFQMSLATGAVVEFDKGVPGGRVICVRP